jgi:Domain of unknown function (DUF4062)
VQASLTFSDLESERKAVSDTLAKSGFIPSGMELFPATDQQQLEFIKRIIDRCDYYVVIVGARYGSLDGDKSFTEKEYEYALSKKIPVLAFIHKDPGKIASEKAERDPERIKRLDSFRARLKASRIVSFWTNVHDLRTEVLTAVTNAVNLSPGVGWVRGDQAIDPKLFQDLERMRNENEELKKRLAGFESGDFNFPTDLAGPEESFGFQILETGKDHRRSLKASWNIGELLTKIADALIAERSESSIGELIARWYVALFDESNFDNHLTYTMVDTDLKQLRFHLEALGLIKAIGRFRERKFSDFELRDEYIVWSITDKGRKFVSTLSALRKGSENQQEQA